MKKGSMLLLLAISFQVSNAQTWNEWFKQRKTQIKYLVNQIAALRFYVGLGQKGYSIVDKGLTTIGNIKSGDFNLHRDFFGALKTVNPKIRNSAQVADIIALQIKIIASQKNAWKSVRHSEYLSPKELKYIGDVYFSLLQKTSENVDVLISLITSGHFNMSDDERVKHIDALHKEMQESYQFVRWFDDQTNVLIVSRRKEKQDSQVGQSLILDKK